MSSGTRRSRLYGPYGPPAGTTGWVIPAEDPHVVPGGRDVEAGSVIIALAGGTKSLLHNLGPKAATRALDHWRALGRFDIAQAVVARFGQNSGELTMLGVDKVSAIRTVLAQVGVPWEDTLAYGDDMNDRP